MSYALRQLFPRLAPRHGNERRAVSEAKAPRHSSPLRERCGRERYLAETHMTIAGLGHRRIGELLARMRHDGCGGRPAFAELLTGVPGASKPVRRIVLIEREG